MGVLLWSRAAVASSAVLFCFVEMLGRYCYSGPLLERMLSLTFCVRDSRLWLHGGFTHSCHAGTMERVR